MSFRKWNVKIENAYDGNPSVMQLKIFSKKRACIEGVIMNFETFQSL